MQKVSLLCLLLLQQADQEGKDTETQGVDLSPRVKESQEFKRWQGLVREAEDSLLLDPAGEKKLQQALALAEKVDPNGALHALTLIKIGQRRPDSLSLLKSQQKFRSILEKAVGIFEQIHGREHAGVALGLHELGSMLVSLAEVTWFDDEDLAQKQRQEAERLLLEAMAIRLKSRGKLHLDILESHRALGSLYDGVENHAKAEEHLRQAIAQWSGLGEPRDIDSSELYESLARTEVELKKWREAEKSYLELIGRRQAAKPPDLEALIDAHETVGRFYLQRRSYSEAEAQFRTALDAGKKAGQEELDLALSWRGLAEALRGQRKHEEALDAWSRLFKMASQDDGVTPASLEILLEMARLEIARVQREPGRLTAARALLDRAMKAGDDLVREEGEVPMAHLRARTLVERGRVNLLDGQAQAGESDLRRSLNLLDTRYCVMCEHAAVAWHEIGRLQVAAGKTAAAEADLRRALEVFDNRGDAEGDPERAELLAALLRDLAAACRKNGKESEAQTLLDRARKLAGEKPAAGSSP